MPSLTKLFKSRDSAPKKAPQPFVNGRASAPKPQWSDAWLRTRVDPEEVVELLAGCTRELKSRALDIPFLLLPFRPTSDPSAARSFVRNYFFPPQGRGVLQGVDLSNELRLTEPMVLSSVMKWCWSRLPGGVVTREAYELFKIGETDAQYARDAFTTFIPISVESEARKQIIFSFFELMAAVAAHGKSNGLGGRKLSRYAGWWAFEHYDVGKGFDVGYKEWASAADAASHLFFAYLRSMSPEAVGGTKAIIGLPLSLQQLVQATDYPPVSPIHIFDDATKVVMVVEAVSPTPHGLLRRAKNFEYRDDDRALQKLASYDDPVKALTDECRRVLGCISSANQSNVSTIKASTSLKAASWSRFEDIGFGAEAEDSDYEDNNASMLGPRRQASGLRSQAASANGDQGRPITPSWADFLSTGFVDERRDSSPSLLPPDKVLPQIQTEARGRSSQSQRQNREPESSLEPGELASIDRFRLDTSFWWVWISSLAGEEPPSRKAVFGRCALIETSFTNGRWMILEEQIQGAAPEPAPGAYIAEKKGFLGFTTRRGRLTRKRSAFKQSTLREESRLPAEDDGPLHRTNIGPDQQAKVQAAAAQLQRRNQEQYRLANLDRRGRHEDSASNKTNSMMTLQPGVVNEASQAMKWASQYDKNEIRAKYLGDSLAGKGGASDSALPPLPSSSAPAADRPSSPADVSRDHELPLLPDHSPSKTPDAMEASNTSSLSKVPLPLSPKESPSPTENPLPETPRPLPPAKDEAPPLPPTPPPSDKASEPIPTTLTAPASTSLAPRETSVQPNNPSPESPAAPVPRAKSPSDLHPEASEPAPSIARKAVGVSQEPNKPGRNRNAAVKMKGIFGSRRAKEPSGQDSSHTAISPAAAAARAALAGRKPIQTTSKPEQTLPSQAMRPSPVAAVSPTQDRAMSSSTPTDHAPEADTEALEAPTSSQPKVPNLPESAHPSQSLQGDTDARPSRPSPENIPLPQSFQDSKDGLPKRPSPENIPLPQSFLGGKNTSSSHPCPENLPLPSSLQGRKGVPRARADSDLEGLSRISTNEREQADHEFSTFDQGPLLDQPAFVPEPAADGPDREEETITPPSEPSPTYIPRALGSKSQPQVQPQAQANDDGSNGTALAKQISPVQDRWAQIRKNAADRVTKPSGEQERPTEVKRTDTVDEKNGEETIESRVARIKARVAELTGNMEGARR